MESVNDVEEQVKQLKRITTAISFFLTGVTIGSVLAKVTRKRDTTSPQSSH